VPVLLCFTGANPKIVSYNGSAVKFYLATSSLVHFEHRRILFYIFWKKRSCSTSTLALYIVVNSEIVGLAPGIGTMLQNVNNKNLKKTIVKQIELVLF
jgi:hypothetical protein